MGLIANNKRCPCGSGLKFKHCHGNEDLKNQCQEMVQLFLFKLILDTKLEKHMVTRKDHERTVYAVTEAMLDLIFGKDKNKEDVEELSDVPEESKDSGSKDEIPVSWDQAKKELVGEGEDRCPTCGRITFGKECIKCKRRM